MGLGCVHRLCVVGSLGEKRLRSHRLLERAVGCEEEAGEESSFFPDPKGEGQRSTGPGTQGVGPS